MPRKRGLAETMAARVTCRGGQSNYRALVEEQVQVGKSAEKSHKNKGKMEPTSEGMYTVKVVVDLV